MIANNFQLNLSYFFAKFEINLKNYEKAVEALFSDQELINEA